MFDLLVVLLLLFYAVSLLSSFVIFLTFRWKVAAAPNKVTTVKREISDAPLRLLPRAAMFVVADAGQEVT